MNRLEIVYDFDEFNIRLIDIVKLITLKYYFIISDIAE